MSRPLRIEYPGALYHIVVHGNGRLWLFKDCSDSSMLLEILEEYLKKYRVIIHNFVIMRNHFHVIAETELPNLSLFMNQLLRAYAMYYNRLHRRRGSVFRSRYGAFLVQRDVYYKQLTKYVFSNPVKARLVKSPYDYQWSSLWYIEHRYQSIRWFDPGVSLALLGGRRALAELLTDPAVPAEVEPVYNQFYGDREWAEGLIDRTRLSEEIRGHGLMERGYITADEIMGAVARHYRVSRADITSRQGSIAAMVAMYLISVHTAKKQIEIGDLFKVKKFAVAQRLNRFKKSHLKQLRIRKVVRSLERKLLGGRYV